LALADEAGYMSATMKAVILAAGRGTRMGELTTNLPKPMLQVEGKPVLEHIIEGLRDEAKIHDIFVIVGWQAQVIRDYFGDGSKWDVKISYGEQKVQDGTGKAPEVAKVWVGDEAFLLASGDILLRPPTDYALLVEAFREDGVIALKAGEDLTKGGAVVLDDKGFMTNIVEKGSSSQPTLITMPPSTCCRRGFLTIRRSCRNRRAGSTN